MCQYRMFNGSAYMNYIMFWKSHQTGNACMPTACVWNSFSVHRSRALKDLEISELLSFHGDGEMKC